MATRAMTGGTGHMGKSDPKSRIPTIDTLARKLMFADARRTRPLWSWTLQPVLYDL